MRRRYDMGSHLIDGTQASVENLISEKYKEYRRGSQKYRILYYLLRSIAGLSAALLPFVVSNNTTIATGLSLAIVITTVIDLIFNPKDQWQLNSEATDNLTVEKLKKDGKYEEYQKLIDILVKTESAKLQRLIGQKALLDEIQSYQNPKHTGGVEPLD